MSNEWLLTKDEIDNIRFKLTKPTSNDEDWIKQVHLTGSQSIARAQLRKVAERIQKMTYEVDRGYDTFWKWNDYESFLQEAGLEVK